LISLVCETKVTPILCRFLNRAALITEGDKQLDGSYTRSWTLCTIEEVEALKTIIRIIPVWSTGIFLSISLGIFSSLTTLQALTMNRHLGPHFKIPAGSFLLFNLLATAVSIFIIDRFFIPTWKNLTRRTLTPLQRIGIGHIINILGLVSSALIEIRRLHVVQTHSRIDQLGLVVPMSAMWLVVPLSILGIGEGFHFPGSVALYYQEFPMSLKSTSTAMVSLLLAIGLYLSPAIMDLVDQITGWLPNDINDGRLDNVYWVLAVTGVVNFGYYLICAKYFKYQQNVEENDWHSELAP
jgi:peptide/histidine transporter 3/4